MPTAAPRVVLLKRSAAPTDDIYVAGPLTPLAAAGAIDLETIESASIGCAFALARGAPLAGRHVILSRYCPPRVLRRLQAMRGGLAGLHYVVDDDIPAAANSPALPDDYRRRQFEVSQREFPVLRELSSQLIVTSPWLLQRLQSPCTVLLDPMLLWEPPPLEHFKSAEFVITFHGTAIHQADLESITPALIEVHDTRSHVRIEIVTSGRIAASLLRRSRVVRRSGMSWGRYRRFMARCRRHVMVVPLMDTPFNRGKSHLKVLDAAGLGAAGVFSSRPPYSDVVQHGLSGLLVDDDVRSWRDAILALVDDPLRTRGIAHEGQLLARRIGDPTPSTHFWRRSFGLGPGPE